MEPSREMRVRTTVIINRPIQEVWAYLDNHNNDLKWRRPSLKSLATVGTGAVGPGTKYEGVVAMGPMKFPYVSELTAYEPPNRVAWKGVSSAGWMIGREGLHAGARRPGSDQSHPRDHDGAANGYGKGRGATG